MPRTTARIKHDEVTRMIKAVQNRNLSIGRVVFDGERLEIIIDNGNNGDNSIKTIDHRSEAEPTRRTPRV